MTQREQKEFIILQEDVGHIKSAVSKIENNVSEINENVSEFNNTMTKLTSKLFNDDDTGEVGYFELTRRNAIKLTKLENLKIAFLTFIFALGSGFWALVNYISK